MKLRRFHKIHKIHKILHTVSFIVGFIGFLPESFSQTEAPGFSLEELEQRALEHYPDIESAHAEISKLEAQLSEVRWSPFNGIRVQGLLAPTPPRKGDAIHIAQDDESYDGTWGILFRTELDINVPLYAFGALSGQREAARHEVKVGERRLEVTKRHVLSKVHQAYHTLQLSDQTRSLLEEGRGYLEKAQQYIETAIEEDVGDITETDRLRVEVLEAEIDARTSDVRRGIRLSKAALRMLADLEENDQISLPPLEAVEYDLRPMRFYLDRALEDRPEIGIADAQAAAAVSRRKSARGRFFPEIRLVGWLDYAFSNVIDDQASPFTNDMFNHLRFEIGLALRWNLDFMNDRARFHQAEARLRQARADEQAAQDRIALDVEQAYINVDENQNLVDARRRARRASRGWLIAIMQGIDIGVLEPPELVDALEAYFQQSFLYLEAVSRFNASVIQLEMAAGLQGQSRYSDSDE